MKTIYISNLDEKFNNEKMSIALGNFDGLHKGHMKLVEELENSQNLKAMLTFYPHPLAILKEKKFKYIDTISDKEKILKDKIDYLIVLKTSKQILNSSKDSFVKFLKNNNIVDVICGKDFRFGKNREGKTSDLGIFNLKVVEDYKINNVRVSSTLIRENLSKGLIEEANELLGRPYSVTGIVKHGAALGRTIGFPTLNLEDLEYLLPKRGVYFGYALIDGVKVYGMINIGLNPTLNLLKEVRLEMNLFEYSRDLYNKEISVYFLDFLRDEKKYDSKKELIKQMNLDKENCINLKK